MCGLPQIVVLTSDNSIFEQVLVFKGTGSELHNCTVYYYYYHYYYYYYCKTNYTDTIIYI